MHMQAGQKNATAGEHSAPRCCCRCSEAGKGGGVPCGWCLNELWGWGVGVGVETECTWQVAILPAYQRVKAIHNQSLSSGGWGQTVSTASPLPSHRQVTGDSRSPEPWQHQQLPCGPANALMPHQEEQQSHPRAYGSGQQGHGQRYGCHYVCRLLMPVSTECFCAKGVSAESSACGALQYGTAGCVQ